MKALKKVVNEVAGEIVGRNAQEWIDENYPNLLAYNPLDSTAIIETSLQVGWNFNIGNIIESASKTANRWRDEELNLDISYKKLQGPLNLWKFNSLKKLNCNSNYLNSLDLTSCSKLQKINCSKNDLTNLDLPFLNDCSEFNCSQNKLTDLNSILNKLNPEKLKVLDLSSNNLPQSDLSAFSKFVNLEVLKIGNQTGNENPERIDYNNLNRFGGSLKPLQNLKSLKTLDISLLRIDGDWENLPDNLETLICRTAGERLRELRNFTQANELFADFGFALKLWKMDRQKQQRITELKKENAELKKQLELCQEQQAQIRQTDFSPNPGK